MTPVPCAEILEPFAKALAGIVAAMAEASVTVAQSSDRPQGGYLIKMTAEAGGEGTLYAQIDRQGAADLVQRALAATDELPESAVIDGLREICRQAIASVIEHRAPAGVRVVVESIDTVTDPADEAAVLKGIVADGVLSPTSVALWGNLVLGVVAPEPVVPAPAGSGARTPPSRAGGGVGGPSLDAILDLELPLIVRFGRAELALKDLAMLAPGAVIDLGRSPHDPVEILVSNQVVARGEVVTVNGNYGVRITDVVGAADRIRHMEIAS